MLPEYMLTYPTVFAVGNNYNIFVPFDMLAQFVAGVDGALGQGACHVLSIRPQGGVEMEVEA